MHGHQSVQGSLSTSGTPDWKRLVLQIAAVESCLRVYTDVTDSLCELFNLSVCLGLLFTENRIFRFLLSHACMCIDSSKPHSIHNFRFITRRQSVTRCSGTVTWQERFLWREEGVRAVCRDVCNLDGFLTQNLHVHFGADTQLCVTLSHRLQVKT